MGQTNMLFDERVDLKPTGHSSAPKLAVAFSYPPIAQEKMADAARHDVVQEPGIRLTEEALARRLAEERILGSEETEVRMRRDFEKKRTQERAKIAESIQAFEQTRKDYFAKVEGEVVQLALSIARKILHREAQVDPLLVTALVQIALSQIKEGSTISVRVRPEEALRWREQLAAAVVTVAATVIEDSERAPGDCVLETEMGSVNFSLDAQLKEVERGFLDVLARTPSF